MIDNASSKYLFSQFKVGRFCPTAREPVEYAALCDLHRNSSAARGDVSFFHAAGELGAARATGFASGIAGRTANDTTRFSSGLEGTALGIRPETRSGGDHI